MARFKCKRCGKEFDGRPGQAIRVFCSKNCYQQYVYEQRHFTCPHNDAVVCGHQKCYSCGWNPKVNQKRMEAMV